MINQVICVTKAYCTRVGGGPFPTELFGSLEKLIRERGNEFGASTGRPRRVGWADGPQLRHASRINSVTGIVITKGDVLQGINTKLGESYRLGNRVIRDLDELDSCEIPEVNPVYQELGIFGDISGCRDFDSLPEPAKNLFQTIGEMAGAPIVAISVGKERGQTIIMKNPWH
jgi:adenylosuccinate synthase